MVYRERCRWYTSLFHFPSFGNTNAEIIQATMTDSTSPSCHMYPRRGGSSTPYTDGACSRCTTAHTWRLNSLQAGTTRFLIQRHCIKHELVMWPRASRPQPTVHGWVRITWLLALVIRWWEYVNNSYSNNRNVKFTIVRSIHIIAVRALSKWRTRHVTPVTEAIFSLPHENDFCSSVRHIATAWRQTVQQRLASTGS